MLLWTTIVVLMLLWLVGMIAHVGGGMIHGLFIIAAILLIYSFATPRRVWG